MSFPSLTETFDAMYSSTAAKMANKAVDQMFRKYPLFFWLNKNNRVTNAGGRWIGRQLILRKNTSAQSFGRGGTFPAVDLDVMTTAKFDWKNVGISLTRYWTDEQENKGDQEMIDLVATNTKVTFQSLQEEMQGQVWSTSVGSDDFHSIPDYVREDPTADATIAGVNQSSESDWRNQYKDATGESPYTYLLKEMRELYMDASQWGDPRYAIAGKNAYSYYEDVAQEQKQITDKRMGDAAFQNVGWKGMPITYDPDCPTGSMYFLDSNFLELVSASGAWFTWTKWKDVGADSLDRQAQLIARGELIITKRKPQAVLFNIGE